MKIIILRHGQASWSSPSDFERELTHQGIEDVTATVAALLKYELIDVYASPYLRTQQTGEIAASVIGCSLKTLNSLVPNGRPADVVGDLPTSVNSLLISHMPLVSNLTAYLCDKTSGHCPSFTTSMALVLDMDTPGPGMASVVARISA